MELPHRQEWSQYSEPWMVGKSTDVLCYIISEPHSPKWSITANPAEFEPCKKEGFPLLIHVPERIGSMPQDPRTCAH